jgi:hypothetical protein
MIFTDEIFYRYVPRYLSIEILCRCILRELLLEMKKRKMTFHYYKQNYQGNMTIANFYWGIHQ